jgi:hypothetical protein
MVPYLCKVTDGHEVMIQLLIVIEASSKRKVITSDRNVRMNKGLIKL